MTKVKARLPFVAALALSVGLGLASPAHATTQGPVGLSDRLASSDSWVDYAHTPSTSAPVANYLLAAADVLYLMEQLRMSYAGAQTADR